MPEKLEYMVGGGGEIRLKSAFPSWNYSYMA